MSSKPSNIVVQRNHQRKEKDTMMSLDHSKLKRELSNLSNEAYHVESSSIPFVWESQPGTPKVRFKENSLPPLTPPPSYFQNATKKATTKAKNKNSKGKEVSLISSYSFQVRSTICTNKNPPRHMSSSSSREI